MALNGSGIRDMARVLRTSPTTVIEELKKGSQLQRINHVVINQRDHEDVHVIIEKVEAAEVDEMWRYVGNTTQQRWLRHAIDDRTGVVLADVLGQQQDEVF